MDELTSLLVPFFKFGCDFGDVMVALPRTTFGFFGFSEPFWGGLEEEATSLMLDAATLLPSVLWVPSPLAISLASFWSISSWLKPDSLPVLGAS